MVNLDKNFFNTADLVDTNLCLKWYNKNPEIYTAIKFKSQIVGYINFMCITKNCFNKFYKGLYKDDFIKPSDIVPFKKNALNYGYFCSIVIKKEYRNTSAVFALRKAFLNQLKNFKDNKIIFSSVICDCVSKYGIKLAKKFNGKYICNSISGGEIYVCELNT